MFLVSLDILTAFDCIHHDVLIDSLVARGWELQRALAAVKELSFLMATVTIPGTEPTDGVQYLKGGVQGGPNTPKDFNAIVETVLFEVVDKWLSRGWGFQPTTFQGAPFGPPITHQVWAWQADGAIWQL